MQREIKRELQVETSVLGSHARIVYEDEFAFNQLGKEVVDSLIFQSRLIQVNLGIILPIIIEFLNLHIFCYLLDRFISIQVFFKILKIVKNITSQLFQSLSCQLAG